MEKDSVAKVDNKKHAPEDIDVPSEIRRNVQLIDRTVMKFESRYLIRVLRSIPSIRRSLNLELLTRIIDCYAPGDTKEFLLSLVDHAEKEVKMEITDAQTNLPIEKITTTKSQPEVGIYLGLLCQIYFVDRQLHDQGIALSDWLVKKIEEYDRRTMDLLASRVYFYYAHLYDLAGKRAEARPVLLNAHRRATLRQDLESQATLINQLLRSYLQESLIEHASKLISRVSFPKTANNSQQSRYAYYLGRINALQLNYGDAFKHLRQAIHKVPQNPQTAGFQQTIYKLLVIVQLLMGEIPERSLFRQANLRKPLLPYFDLVKAVRIGDLNKFQEVLAKYNQKFQADNTMTLILRLRQNVIRTGIRMIACSYSRISLANISSKLHLDNVDDAEFIVAKAIRDGVVEAVIDYDKRYVQFKERADIFFGDDPQKALDRRIGMCLDLHNDAVKAMRFPLNMHEEELKSAEAARERERELVQEISEADIDEDDELGEF